MGYKRYTTSSSLALVTFLFLCISCDSLPTKLKIHNNSNIPIYATFGMNLIIPPTVDYPVRYFIENQIQPNKTGIVKSWSTVENWDYFIDKCVNKEIHVFVFSLDTIKKYGYRNSAIRVKYIKAYAYNKHELDSCHWIIEYK